MKKKVISSVLMICIFLNLLSSMAYAATKNTAKPSGGWYYLRIMGNYLNIDKMVMLNCVIRAILKKEILNLEYMIMEMVIMNFS